MVKSLFKTLGVVLLAAAIGAAYVYWPVYSPSLAAVLQPLGVHLPAATATDAPTPLFPVLKTDISPLSAPATAAAPAVTQNSPLQFAPALVLDLPAAIDQELVQAEFQGNGREKMSISVTNKGRQHVRLHVPAGLVFQNATCSVVLVRARDIDLRAGESKQADLQTAATSSSNKVASAAFSPTLQSEVNLSPLLNYLQLHPEISSAAVQTAVLALKENLPVSAFAKFAEAGGDLPSSYDTSAFKVDVSDIIVALQALHDIGVPDDRLALTIDPQLKIEAMIDPLSHALAMRYYGITPDNEWAYWKQHLLQGEESTRHYALYGIARFYPDVALQMLPSWVREARTSVVFRMSAVQALADTQRPEAVSILRQIEHEFGMLTDIGKTAHNAANVLEERLNRNTDTKIAFRLTDAQERLALK